MKALLLKLVAEERLCCFFLSSISSLLLSLFWSSLLLWMLWSSLLECWWLEKALTLWLMMMMMMMWCSRRCQASRIACWTD